MGEVEVAAAWRAAEALDWSAALAAIGAPSTEAMKTHHEIALTLTK
jgi:hypothetical protein